MLVVQEAKGLSSPNAAAFPDFRSIDGDSAAQVTVAIHASATTRPASAVAQSSATAHAGEQKGFHAQRRAPLAGVNAPASIRRLRQKIAHAGVPGRGSRDRGRRSHSDASMR
jgi:hypothetical protein